AHKVEIRIVQKHVVRGPDVGVVAKVELVAVAGGMENKQGAVKLFERGRGKVARLSLEQKVLVLRPQRQAGKEAEAGRRIFSPDGKHRRVVKGAGQHQQAIQSLLG